MKTSMKILCLCLLVLALLNVSPSWAQESSQVNSDYDQRIKLAIALQEFAPSRARAEALADVMSLRVPSGSRETYRSMLLQSFDYAVLEKETIKALAEVYTVEELEKMIDFYGSVEGQSIEKKIPLFEDVMKPHLKALLDEALLNVKTGARPN